MTLEFLADVTTRGVLAGRLEGDAPTKIDAVVMHLS
jgi:hypothetical protein